MIFKTGRIYHIKNQYFVQFKNANLMINNDINHKSRPSYLAIKTRNIYWFIPLSTKIDKYKKIIQRKNLKYKKCKSIVICKIRTQEYVFLIQNAFPVNQKYIKSYHYINNNPVDLCEKDSMLIRNNLYYMLSLKKEGLNLFFTDIDSILKELDYDKSK